MIDSTDLLIMAATAIGNKALKEGELTAESLENFSNSLSMGFHTANPDLDRLTIEPEDGKNCLFSEWLILNKEALSFLAIPQREVFEEQQAHPEFNNRLLNAFEGNNQLLLGVKKKDNTELYTSTINYPSRYIFKARDITGFMENNSRSHKLKEHLLWQNEHNLHFSKENNWEAFKTSFTDDKVDEFMQLWSIYFSGMEPGFYADWDRFAKDYENPDKQVKYFICFIGSVKNYKYSHNFQEQKQKMIQTLEKIKKFAEQNEDSHWAKHFDSVITIIKTTKIDENPFIEIFTQCGLSLEAQALMEGTMRSDVFGGMGSWNDVPYMNQPEYAQVSDALFTELYTSLCSAVNSLK